MKNKTKKNICCAIVALNFILMLGLTGSCDIDKITMIEYVKSVTIVGACTIIPALKSGLFK